MPVLQRRILWVLLAIIAKDSNLPGVFNFFEYFMTGIFLADIMTLEMETSPKNYYWDIFSILAWSGIVLVLCNKFYIPILLPLLFFIIFIAAFKGKYNSRLFSTKFLCITGGMCYTIYLYHYFIISYRKNLPVSLPNW